jgi:NAD(P)H-hydrate epimerase
MTPLTLNRRQSREVDRRAVDEFGMNGLVLMENAGRGVADLLCGLGIAGPVLVCCGKGNNGGDGFVVARHLDLRGYAVRILLWARPGELRGDAAANFEIATRAGLPIDVFAADHDAARLDRRLADAAWVVDALLGTGSQGAPRRPLDAAIRQLNDQGAAIVAVDLPSGLDADTGAAAEPTIRARHTCTFVAAKPGFLVPGADQFTGQVHVVDIGVPRRLVDSVARGEPRP